MYYVNILETSVAKSYIRQGYCCKNDSDNMVLDSTVFAYAKMGQLKICLL